MLLLIKPISTLPVFYSLAPPARLKKRRGSQRGSVTRLITRVTELEALADQPVTADHARQLLIKLRAHDQEFKSLHFQIIDSIAEENEEEH